jgi:hypothetical protein
VQQIGEESCGQGITAAEYHGERSGKEFGKRNQQKQEKEHGRNGVGDMEPGKYIGFFHASSPVEQYSHPMDFHGMGR